jgi:hypothetical protein
MRFRKTRVAATLFFPCRRPTRVGFQTFRRSPQRGAGAERCTSKLTQSPPA